MKSLTIVCLAVIATVALSSNIATKKGLFSPTTNNPHFKLLPKDFGDLENEISQESPLILFIRSGQGAHDKNEKYNSMFTRIKQTARNATGADLNNDDRFYYFDPELDATGNRQVQKLKEQLQTSGWMEFLERVEPVQYISSPLTRSIQTALQVVPTSKNPKIIIDEGVRPRICPIGIDLRRNFKSPLHVHGDTLESIQTKFKHHKNRLLFQMANCDSNNVYEKFGYYSDEDPNIKNARWESDQELDERITKWMNMLRPISKEEKSTVTHLMDKILPDPIQKKLNKLPPKVYVVFTNQRFIDAVIDRLDLDGYNSKGLNFCEVVPVVLNFGSATSSSSDTASAAAAY